MKDKLQTWFDKYDALSLRERGIIALLAVVVLFTLWNELFFSPLNDERKRFNSEINNLSQQVASINIQLAELMAGKRADPNKVNQQRLVKVKAEIGQQDDLLKKKMHGLIDPTQMAEVLESVLMQKTDLQFQQLKSLGARPLLGPTAQNDTNKNDTNKSDTGKPGVSIETVVYRHGMQIEFKGSYLSTLEYLRALEALPWDFYWDAVAFEVDEYPAAHVTITVHTLSLKEGWIGV